MHTVKLYIAGGTWMAQHSDPMIAELFGSDTIPTAFTEQLSGAEVIERVSVKMPQYTYTLRGAAL